MHIIKIDILHVIYKHIYYLIIRRHNVTNNKGFKGIPKQISITENLKYLSWPEAYTSAHTDYKHKLKEIKKRPMITVVHLKSGLRQCCALVRRVHYTI